MTKTERDLRKALTRMVKVAEKMMPGVAFIVMDIGELNGAFLEAHAALRATEPAPPPRDVAIRSPQARGPK